MIFRGTGFFQIIISLAVALFSLSFHETAHGLAAYAMGDDTAKSMGRLSLNPIKHIDIIGLLMMLVAGFGWAKAVPINMNRFKDPKKGMALSALAGPLANIVLALITAIIWSILLQHFTINEYVSFFLQMLFYVNCMLAMFNLIPIPPLDGSKVVFAILPQKYYYKLMYIERYGFIILIIFINLPIFNSMLSTGVTNLMKALEYIAGIIV